MTGLLHDTKWNIIWLAVYLHVPCFVVIIPLNAGCRNCGVWINTRTSGNTLEMVLIGCVGAQPVYVFEFDVQRFVSGFDPHAYCFR